MIAFVLVPMILVATVAAARAGEASEAVRPFYLQPGLELEASARDRFIDPARKILNQNDEIRQGGDEGCLDPSLPFNDSDYDPAVVAEHAHAQGSGCRRRSDGAGDLHGFRQRADRAMAAEETSMVPGRSSTSCR